MGRPGWDSGVQVRRSAGRVTNIEWTNETWNPVRGCSIVSEGCRNCYAMHQAHRFSGPGKPYEGLTRSTPSGPKWTGKIRLVPEVLDQPFRWRKPRRVFVNSMSDLFHEDVPPIWVRTVFDKMERAPQHTFQVLTKRPERMLDMLTNNSMFLHHRGWPLPNIWLGISCEDQATADERIPLLLQTPAAIRFLSCEPLLGPIDVRPFLPHDSGDPAERFLGAVPDKAVDWVIVGGESGPSARPMDLLWAREIVAECQEAGVAVFVKQLGARPYAANGWQGFDLDDPRGGDPDEWPEELRVREWPEAVLA